CSRDEPTDITEAALLDVW
nr:immunoglobulin heavy chain junction region [Macaca mulatta]MOW98114.1 immunoglobulin heavy chain junction region [Macaca mulatta]MOW98266.1 immunoglobulin heavy chain junction region [Macaca mulatta]MOW98299.1 immunoglobulin heavy chain junction region [Macaca mulatta]MOW98474.1 immunoglobulin heavy chain junction region [Macaca mulatta]